MTKPPISARTQHHLDRAGGCLADARQCLAGGYVWSALDSIGSAVYRLDRAVSQDRFDLEVGQRSRREDDDE